MKTPEQIKTELTAWGTGIILEHEDGTFSPPGFFQRTVAEVCRDALAYIQQLEADLQRERDEGRSNKSRLAQVERERDAAVNDLADSKECDYCKYKDEFPACGEKSCYSCDKECPCAWCCKAGDGFKWRGVCEENTKEART